LIAKDLEMLVMLECKELFVDEILDTLEEILAHLVLEESKLSSQ